MNWPAELWPLLSDAESELARLDGTGKLLADPELLLTPLREREALKSSSLEGTYTDPEGQMAFNRNPKEPTSTADPANAYREVFNYGQALRLGEQLREELPLSTRLIRQLHATLMEAVRGQNKRPGELRDSQVHIGHPPRFVPPPADRVADCLHNLEIYLNAQEPTLRPLVGVRRGTFVGECPSLTCVRAQHGPPAGKPGYKVDSPSRKALKSS